MRRIQLLVVVGGLAITAPFALALAPPRHGRSTSVGRNWAVMQTTAGPANLRVSFSEPAGVIRLFRVTAPRGARVSLAAAVPTLTRVDSSLPAASDDPSETCDRRGHSLVCTQREEACPMPPATWVVRIHKRSGPAGRIKITFVIGPVRRAR